MKQSLPQFAKEARQLAWPWTLFVLAGSLVLVHPWLSGLPDLQMGTGAWNSASEWILLIGAFFGSSLLATLPLGSEFQYGTLALRLAQPVERGALWRQKLLVTFAAVAPPAVIYCLALDMRFGRPFSVMVASWIVMTTVGAMPYTLLARSTMGGMVLNNFGTSGVTFAWMYYEGHSHLPLMWFWTIGIVLAAYVGAMIWLGRRVLLRFQAVDGMQASEAFVPGARLVPRVVAEWFRCRPTEPLRNLVRREFRLLRTVWPLSLLYLAAWIFLVTFRRLPADRPHSLDMVFVLTITFGVLIAVLAGTLSLGEEKTWGTHDWQMTAPVSVSVQWAVKLVFALFTSLVCAALLPMSVLTLGGWIDGSAQHYLNGSIPAVCIAEAVGLTLAAFWCACVVKGTVQATLWVFPLCLSVLLAVESASWGLKLLAHPFHKFLAYVVSRFDAVAAERVMSQTFAVFSLENVLAMAVAPLLAVGLIQSHRFFRAQIGANKLRVVRCALPLVIVAFLCSLGHEVLMGVFSESRRQQSTIFRETDSAIAALEAEGPQMDSAHPRRFSPKDLASASPLSDGTQRWLRSASIIVAPAPDRIGAGPGSYFPGRSLFFVSSSGLKNRVSYSAVVRAANGTECSMMFQVQKQGPVGFLTAICE